MMRSGNLATLLKVLSGLALGVLSAVIFEVGSRSVSTGAGIFIAVAVAILLYFLISDLNFRRLVTNNRTGVVGVYENQGKASKRITFASRNANQIDIIVVRGLGILSLKNSLVRKNVDLKTKPSFRVLVLDPRSNYCRIRAREIGETEDAFVDSLQAGISGVWHFKEQSGAIVELRAYDALPVWRVIRMDDTVFVSCFVDGVDGHDAPVYEIRSGPPHSLFAAWLRYFDSEWERAKVMTRAGDVRG